MTTVRLPVYDDKGLAVPGYAEVDLLELMRVMYVKLVPPVDSEPEEPKVAYKTQYIPDLQIGDNGLETVLIAGGKAYPLNELSKEDLDELQGYVIESRPKEEYVVQEFHTKTRDECKKVLTSMRNVIAQYDEVRVADLYALVGIQSEFVDTRWGWRREDLSKAKIKSSSGGLWQIVFPLAISLRAPIKKD